MRPLLATDLDRTLLPNGAAPESPGVRELFTRWVLERDLQLAYVSGRRLELVQAAIESYGVPTPDHVIADVGGSLHHRVPGGYERVASWDGELAQDWPSIDGPAVLALLAEQARAVGLAPQEPAAQGRFKASLQAPRGALSVSREAALERLRARAEAVGLRTSVVHSVDLPAGLELVDLLPARSTKLGALEHLLARLGLGRRDLVFAGDSGNDREVLGSGMPTVLVANGDADLRAELAATQPSCHLAQGDLGLNGNYAAGILEGWLAHHPADRPALERLVAQRTS